MNNNYDLDGQGFIFNLFNYIWMPDPINDGK
jgi:hypothetical protein